MVILVSLLVDYDLSLYNILLNSFILLSYLFASSSPITDIVNGFSLSTLDSVIYFSIYSLSTLSIPSYKDIFVVLGIFL